MMNGTSSSLFPCNSSIIFLFYMKYKVEEMLQHSLQLALTTLCIAKHSLLFFLFISMEKVDSLHAGPCHLGVWAGGGGGGGGVGCITQPPKKSKKGAQIAERGAWKAERVKY